MGCAKKAASWDRLSLVGPGDALMGHDDKAIRLHQPIHLSANDCIGTTNGGTACL
jgi:hypothetical protein